ncbi:MAG: hypothetical protein GXO48_05750 [Chlorobi bacterium]|nr:hypothetical protein [Chlorobiota bacterium]
MLNRYTILLLWWFVFFSASSEDDLPSVFSNRTLALSMGYGVPNLSAKMFDVFNSPQYNSLVRTWGPIHFRAEQAVSHWFGIGISFNIAYMEASWKESDPFNPSKTYSKHLQLTAMSFLLRSWIHFVPNHPFIDPYFSFGFGYRWNEIQYNNGGDPNDYNTIVYELAFPVAFEAALGFRYYLTRNLALYMETGIAKSIINIGFTFKIERDPMAL